MAEDNAPFATVQFDYGQPDLHFSTPEELLKWVESEKKFWEWAAQCTSLRSLASKSDTHWVAIIYSLEKYIENPQPTLLNQIQQQAQTLKHGLRLTSSDGRAQYVSQLAMEDKNEAGQVLLQFLRELNLNSNTILSATKAALFEIGMLDGTAEAEIKALAKTRGNWAEFTGKASTLSKTLMRCQQDLEARSTNLLEETKAAHEAMLTDGKAELTNIAVTYNEKLAVQSSVEYWGQRVANHAEKASQMLTFIARYAVCVGAAIIGVVWCLAYNAQGMYQSQVLLDLANSKLMGSYWPIAVLLGIGLVVVWPIRIATRIYLSCIHLETAAEERVTMIKTYLALLRSDQAIEPADRHLILESLFKHLATGIVKDDGAPSNPIIDAANRMVSR